MNRGESKTSRANFLKSAVFDFIKYYSENPESAMKQRRFAIQTYEEDTSLHPVLSLLENGHNMTHFVSHKGSFCQYLKVKTFPVTDVCLEKDEVKKC